MSEPPGRAEVAQDWPHVDKQIYGAAKRTVTNIVPKAKSDYFSSRIAKSNCSEELFGVCNELRGCNSDLPLPTAFPVCELPDVFAGFFIWKVKTIRDELHSQMPASVLPTDDPYQKHDFAILAENMFTRPTSHLPLC